MSDPNQPSVPPGWYPDGQGGQRWWDGVRWTEHTQPDAPEETPDLHSAQTQVAPHQPGGATPFTPPAQPPQQSGKHQPYPPQQPYPPPQQAGRQQGYPQQYGQQPYQQHGQPQQAYGQQPYAAQHGQPYAPPGQFPAPRSGGSTTGLLVGGLIGGGVILLVCLVGGIFMLSSGSGPGKVVEEYLEAYGRLDMEKACELSAEDARKQILETAGADSCSDVDSAIIGGQDEYFKQTYGQTYDDVVDDMDIDVEIEEVDEDGDEARVKALTTGTYNGSNDKVLEDLLDGEKTSEETSWYYVVKEDGEWKVAEECSDRSSCG